MSGNNRCPEGDNAADPEKSGVSTHIDWGAVRGALARIDDGAQA